MARSSRSRYRCRTAPRWIRSRRPRGSRSTPSTATPWISRRPAGGCPKPGPKSLARLGFLALHAAVGALEEVTHARHRLDDLTRSTIRAELAAQPADVQLH